MASLQCPVTGPHPEHAYGRHDMLWCKGDYTFPPADESWRDRYKAAVISWFILRGKPAPVAEEDSEPWDNGVSRAEVRIREHLGSCEVDIQASTLAEETSWRLWGGTFGSDEVKYGVQVTVTCRCQQVLARPFFVAGVRMVDLINGIAGEPERSRD